MVTLNRHYVCCCRIRKYEEVYEPIDDRSFHYIKLIDMVTGDSYVKCWGSKQQNRCISEHGKLGLMPVAC